MDKHFAPGTYGMVICPLCDGKGFLIKDSEGTGVFVRNVCVKCGGFGAIKEEEEVLGSPGNQIQSSEGDGLELSETVCERRSSGDAAEENRFLPLETAILKTSGGNKGLDRSQRNQKRSGFQKGQTLAIPLKP